MSELLFVAVPGGRARDGVAVLRVVVVPRLTGGGRLRDHPDIVDWPATVDTARFTVELAGAEPQTLEPEREGVDPDAWRRFFGPETVVRPWQPQTYPDPEVDLTTGKAADVAGTFAKCARNLANPQTVRETVGGTTWHARRPTGAPPLSTETEHHFHRSVAVLREHPHVLRTLGLILELRLAAAAVPERTEQPGTVRVGWAGRELTATAVSPATAYEFDGDRFLPAAAESGRNGARGGVRDGVVDLAEAGLVHGGGAPGPWAIATFDVDHGVDRLAATARSLRSDAGQASLPALRSAGLMLLRPGRQQELANRNRVASTNAGRESMSEATLTADDLVLGYRIDIWDRDERWKSLCGRRAAYFVDEHPVGAPVSEEAHLKPHATVAEQPTPDTVRLRADEVVVRWSGWSLALPPPFVRSPERAPADVPFRLRWQFDRADEPLPQLRFGGEYRLRVRIADLAGGGLELPGPSPSNRDSEPVVYTRHEPIPSPVVQLPADSPDLGPGGTLVCLVIRSEGGPDPDPPTAAAFGQAHPDYPANDRRTLLAPPTSLALAEQHGRLDGEDQRTWQWARRAMVTGDLPDPAAERMTVHIQPGPEGHDSATFARRWDGEWPDRLPKQLGLRETRDEGPALHWEVSDQVWVELPPGEQVTVELSSGPDPDGIPLDHFAVKQWGIPDAAKAAARQGRHPMLSPAKQLQLVHAVLRPLAAPAGSLHAGRAAEGQTTAGFAPVIDVHTASTGQLDVTATWTERDQVDGSRRELTELVHSTPVQRSGEQVVRPSFRQEFGDTRHRRVSYTISAISRHRQFFEARDDQVFTVTSEPEEVSIPSSARPDPPVVRSVVPAFRWQVREEPGTLIRTRLGRRLRVELAAPWYQTGEGEQLAVVVSPGGAAPPRELWPFVTQLGRDPIRLDPAPGRWPTRSMVRVGEDFQPYGVELDGNGAPEPGGAPAMAVPHQVEFQDGHWYADVELQDDAPGLAYCPFVRLAVARYQPESLPSLALSQVVATEPVPLLPDRTLTVRWSADRVRVRLDGIGPADGDPGPNRVEVALERCNPPPGTEPAGVTLTALTPADGVLAWTRVEGRPTPGRLGEDLSLRIPAEPGAWRVYVREVEQLTRDPASAPAPGTAAEIIERTVYLDTVPIPATG